MVWTETASLIYWNVLSCLQCSLECQPWTSIWQRGNFSCYLPYVLLEIVNQTVIWSVSCSQAICNLMIHGAMTFCLSLKVSWMDLYVSLNTDSKDLKCDGCTCLLIWLYGWLRTARTWSLAIILPDKQMYQQCLATTWGFIVRLLKCLLLLPLLRQMNAVCTIPYCLRSILVSSHLDLGLRNGLFSQVPLSWRLKWSSRIA
jgi:hypothetical protein